MSCAILTGRADVATRLEHRFRSISIIGCITRIISQAVRSDNEPVNRRVHESEDGRQGVEHGEVELLSKTGHVSRKRHELDEKAFDATLVVLGVRVVEMGEGPRLEVWSAGQLSP